MENAKTESKVTNFGKSVLRVERSYNDLLQFKMKLSSYLCEPTTYKQYASREELSEKINNQIKSHKELLDVLKTGNAITKPETQIKERLQAVKLVEKGVSAYISAISSLY